jgi:hypothetical protein
VKQAEPSPEALVRASAVVGRAIRPGPLTPAAAQQRDVLIRAIARELDDLAGPLQALLEGIRHPDQQAEAFRARVSLASAALWRFQGQPEGRLP